jgi:glycosyltransferase involved in cell wall biosynthesis
MLDKKLRPQQFDNSLATPHQVRLPDGKPWPKISIVTPSFNQGRYIEETIQSVLTQGYPNVEHIVIDGGSTDETLDVLERYRSKLAHFVSESDRGQSHAINKGFALATGDIVTWLNSDDQLAPGALYSVAYAFAMSGADLVSGICEIYKDNVLSHRHIAATPDGPLPLNDLLDLDNGWNAGQFFYQPEVFFSRDLLMRAGGNVREDLYYSMDYELWLRFALVKAKLHVIGRPLARFRLHAEQKTASESKFKAELQQVKTAFIQEHALTLNADRRAHIAGRVLRVAFLNDVGWNYGAGIAHLRMAMGFDMGGHDVEAFALTDYDDLEALEADVTGFNPDLIVFGNVHKKLPANVALIDRLSAKYRSYWITHDFWLLTGRCAYPGSCGKYLNGCDASCPTAKDYPALAPSEIAPAWSKKQVLLKSQHAPLVVGNSNWARDVSQHALRTQGAVQSHVPVMRLGVPTDVFTPLPKELSRESLGIAADRFVVAFSISAISEKRKGGNMLLNALRRLRIPKLTLLVLGNVDVPLDAGKVDVVKLGYLEDPQIINGALSAADLLIGASLEETLGQTFIEAAAAGVPTIGFRQTGMMDSMVPGVTCFVVPKVSSRSLLLTLQEAYRNLDKRRNIAALARIHAENEWSIEAAWRVNFNVLRATGIVDAVGVPHRATLVRKSRYGAVENAKDAWYAVSGISHQEGPYPEFNIPHRFNWAHGEEARIAVASPIRGQSTLTFSYHNILFDNISCKVQVNGKAVDTVNLTRTDTQQAGEVSFEIQAMRGINKLILKFDRVSAPTEIESRALTIMLRTISLQTLQS